MNKGYFKEGTIELKNTNYKIAGTLEASEIMQKIEENIIYLKQINYGTEAIADITNRTKGRRRIYNREPK